VDTAERPLAQEARRNMDELVLTLLRDGKEWPVTDLLSVIEAIALSFTGVGAMPDRLDEEHRQKAELNSALNRLKQAEVLQVQGAGAQRQVKLTSPPDWLLRLKEVLDQAEAEASRELLKLLGDGGWHLTDTLLASLQDLPRPKVSEIGHFAVAYAAVERALREGACVRRTSGQKGTTDFVDEIKVSGLGQASETQMADSSIRPSDRPEAPATIAPAGEEIGQTQAAAAGVPSQPMNDQSTSRRENQSGQQAPTGDVDSGGRQDGPGAGGDAAGAGAGRAPDLQPRAGFLPNGGTAEVVHIDIDLIDLDDDEDKPLSEVVGLSQSIDNLGLLALPGIRDGLVEGRYRPVFGRRRLRELKEKGWTKLHCILLRVDDRTAELAAIDENLIRSELTVLERADSLRRRKQIYEEVHPGAARPKGGRPPKNGATVAPFSEDAAQRTGSSPRKVQLDIEIADKLTEPTKKVLRPTPFADRTATLAKLAKMEPREQLPVARVLAKGQATSVEAATAILEERKRLKAGGGENADSGSSAPAEGPEGRVERASFEILTGDCLNHLPAQTPGKFRLIFADPPHNEGVDYGEGSSADELPEPDYLASLRTVLDACVPLLSEDGSLWFLTRDKFVHAVRDLLIQAGMHPQSWIKIYEPPGEGSSRGFLSSSLHLLHGTKSADQLVFHPEGLEQSISRCAAEIKALTTLGCKPTDYVWVVPRLKDGDPERIPSFPVQRRKALLQPVIRCATAAGDWVLDPFSGSATAGVVALEEGRHYVGIEKSAQFAELSRGRLAAVLRPSIKDQESTNG
jgi:DNA modification methylase